VIDDDPLFRSLIVSLLRKDCIVGVASEGSEGFYKALEHPPDVALIDVQMPGWDGLKTLKAFRGHPALADVRIMMLTSDASKETVLAAINGGSNDYVIKTSFSKDDFRQKLNRLAPRSAAEKPADAQGTNGSDGSQSPGASQPFARDEQKLQELIDGWE